MNKTSRTHTRVACRLVRHLSIDAPADQASWAGRHVAQCADCARYFAASSELETLLKREAQLHAVPEGRLPESIMRRIEGGERAAAADDARRGRRFSPWGWAGALGTAAMITIVGLNAVKSRNTDVQQADLQSEVSHAVAAAQELTTRMWTRVQPSARALNEANILEEEIESVYADANRALQFLAANFVPTQSAEGPANRASDADRQG